MHENELLSLESLLQDLRQLVAQYEQLLPQELLAPLVTLVPNDPDPEPEPEPIEIGGRLTGAMVRQAAQSIQGAFTLRELASFMARSPSELRPFIKAMAAGSTLKQVGSFQRQPMYEFHKPEPEKVNREARRPPEKEPPAMLESRATGVPVRRSAAQKAGKKARSTPGTRHRLIMRDRRYEQMQKVKEERAEEQRRKGQQ